MNIVRHLQPRQLVARLAALLFSIVIALTCTHWATADSGWSRAAPAKSPLASLVEATAWINSPPLDENALRGKVVLVDFWTYSCVNCLRTLPHVRAWAQKYAAHGLVVIGAHAPEFDFERSVRNVQRATKDLGVAFPVAVDGRNALWKAFGNQAWPTFYFVDGKGRVRYRQIGEGSYDQAERMIQQLLREAGRDKVPSDLVSPQGQGTQAAAGAHPPASSEAYLGVGRAEGFLAASGTLRAGPPMDYAPARQLDLNQWTLAGVWKTEPQHIELAKAGGRIVYRFRARDLHLVLGPGNDDRPVRFKVRIDGRAPGEDHGSDTDPEGVGRIEAHRLYQLVRQNAGARERLFEIEFLEPGVRAYAFTFG
ncbi:MAG: redoxin family protein [Rhizobacter sp.]